MAIEEAVPPSAPAPGDVTAPLRLRWGRPLAILTAIVFVISAIFPVVAGLSKDTQSFPKWWGPLDVGIALILGIVATALVTLVGDQLSRQAVAASYRGYRILLHGVLVMLVVFFVAGDRIVWPNCLTGFAWRSWLGLYALPAWLTALRLGEDASERAADRDGGQPMSIPDEVGID